MGYDTYAAFWNLWKWIWAQTNPFKKIPKNVPRRYFFAPLDKLKTSSFWITHQTRYLVGYIIQKRWSWRNIPLPEDARLIHIIGLYNLYFCSLLENFFAYNRLNGITSGKNNDIYTSTLYIINLCYSTMNVHLSSS